MSYVLAHQAIGPEPGADVRTAFVLHGILGSARNWLSFARKLAPQLPGRRFVLVDLRNHGESGPAPDPQTVAACAADLEALAAALGERPDVVIGHSFGGKVALAYARDRPAGLAQVWMLDALPGPAGEGGGEAVGEIDAVLQALRRVPLPVASRQVLVDTLRADGLSEPLAQWMTTNLRHRPEGGFVWRFDLPAVERMLADYFATDLWPFLEAGPGVAVHIVRAGRSDRWTPAVLDRLAPLDRRGVSLHVLPAAGHWVHTDDPEGLAALLLAHVPR